MWLQDIIRLLFQIIQVLKPYSWTRNILIKSTGIEKNLQQKTICSNLKQCFYHKWFWKLRSKTFKSFIWFKDSYVICMSFACYLYVTRMYSYVICMSLGFTRMSFVCQSYVLACHSYVTCMYSYVIHMSLICHSYVIRMSLLCTRVSSVCHSYVLVCHPYVTRMYSYVIRMSLLCGFTMNQLQQHSLDVKN